MWEYQRNAVHQSYERVSFCTLQIMEPEGNPIERVDGLNFLPPRPVMIDELPEIERGRLVPAVRAPPPPRPPPPNFGRTGATGQNPILLDSPPQPASPNSLPSLESPASPSSAGTCSPVDSPTKRASPSPPASPSRIRCENPIYIPRQDHQFLLLDCPTANSPTLRDPSIGFTGTLWPGSPALQPSPGDRGSHQRRHAPPPPPLSPISRPQRGRLNLRNQSYSPGRGIPSDSSFFLTPCEESKKLV